MKIRIVAVLYFILAIELMYEYILYTATFKWSRHIHPFKKCVYNEIVKFVVFDSYSGMQLIPTV